MLLWLGVLQRYRLTVSFTDDLGIPNRPGAVAKVGDGYPYRNVDIVYKRSFIDGADLETVEEVTLHEILHVELFGPLERFLEERGVTLSGFLAPEEVGVDLMTLWLTRMRHSLGDRAWEILE